MCCSKPLMYHYDCSIHMPNTLAKCDIPVLEKYKNCHCSCFLIGFWIWKQLRNTYWQPIEYKKSFSTGNGGFERIATLSLSRPYLVSKQTVISTWFDRYQKMLQVLSVMHCVSYWYFNFNRCSSE